MKVLVTLVALVATVSSASALTTQYTSELEPYSNTRDVANLSEEDVRLALDFISTNRSEGEKRAFIRELAK